MLTPSAGPDRPWRTISCWVTCNSIVATTSPGGALYRSTDGGKAFVEVAASVSLAGAVGNWVAAVFVTAAQVVLADQGGHVWLMSFDSGTEIFSRFTTTDGKRLPWCAIVAGLGGAPASTRRLYVLPESTHGRSIYYTDDSFSNGGAGLDLSARQPGGLTFGAQVVKVAAGTAATGWRPTIFGLPYNGKPDNLPLYAYCKLRADSPAVGRCARGSSIAMYTEQVPYPWAGGGVFYSRAERRMFAVSRDLSVVVGYHMLTDPSIWRMSNNSLQSWQDLALALPQNLAVASDGKFA